MPTAKLTEEQRAQRLGAVNRNKSGSLMTVIEYNHANSLYVKFEGGDTKHASWRAFRQGKIQSVYDKSKYGVGFYGEGRYMAVDRMTKKITPAYTAWDGMMARCYSEKLQKKRPTYVGCAVHPSWHNYQVFAEWFEANYYTIPGERMCLDKDIITKHNKVYAPDTCVIVPISINSLFVKKDANRGALPLGVVWSKVSKRYVASCTRGERANRTRLILKLLKKLSGLISITKRRT